MYWLIENEFRQDCENFFLKTSIDLFQSVFYSLDLNLRRPRFRSFLYIHTINKNMFSSWNYISKQDVFLFIILKWVQFGSKTWNILDTYVRLPRIDMQDMHFPSTLGNLIFTHLYKWL